MLRLLTGALVALLMTSFPAAAGQFAGLLYQSPHAENARSLSKFEMADAIETADASVIRPGAAEAILAFVRERGMSVRSLAEFAAFIRSDQVGVETCEEHIGEVQAMGRYHLTRREVTHDYPRQRCYPGENVLVWRNPETGRKEAFLSLLCGNTLLLTPPPVPITPCTVRWWVPKGWVGGGYATLAFRKGDVEAALECLPESAVCDEDCTEYFNRPWHDNRDVRAMQSALGRFIRAINVDRPGRPQDSEGFWIVLPAGVEVWNCEGKEAFSLERG